MDAIIRNVSPDYFASMGIRVTRGRGFRKEDVRGSEQVMLVNATFTAKYLAGNPLDVVLTVPFHAKGDLSTAAHRWRIVGVVADVKTREPASRSCPRSSRRSINSMGDRTRRSG